MNDTVKVYDAMVEEYVAIAGDLPSTLPSFLKQLRPGARVLDLGCGPGHHAAAMAQLGHRVLAVDASAEMIRHAAANPGVSARQGTFDDIPDLGEFDGVWASFALLHAPKKDFPDHLAAIHRALKTGGVLVLALKIGTGEHRDRLGRFYAYYQEDELTDLLKNAGFHIDDILRGTSEGMAGTNDPFVTIFAHG